MISEIEENFGRIWPWHVAHLTEFLVASRAVFGGDLDLFLVLCVIGERSFSYRNAPEGMDFAEWQASSERQAIPEDINLQCISDYSGIPRETVRRKLQRLLDFGWVERDDRGYLSATIKSKDDLEPLTLASMRYIERMFTVMREALPDPRPSIPDGVAPRSRATPCTAALMTALDGHGDGRG
jgi:hypothetical protein